MLFSSSDAAAAAAAASPSFFLCGKDSPVLTRDHRMRRSAQTEVGSGVVLNVRERCIVMIHVNSSKV